jgi:hypothetical protein
VIFIDIQVPPDEKKSWPSDHGFLSILQGIIVDPEPVVYGKDSDASANNQVYPKGEYVAIKLTRVLVHDERWLATMLGPQDLYRRLPAKSIGGGYKPIPIEKERRLGSLAEARHTVKSALTGSESSTPMVHIYCLFSRALTTVTFHRCTLSTMPMWSVLSIL